MVIPGFHSAGLLLHDVPTAIDSLAEIGYRAVVVRTHRNLLSEAGADLVDAIGEARRRTRVELIWDSEGYYLSDPWVFEPPGLGEALESSAVALSAREQLICRSLDLAKRTGSRLVTFGVGPELVGVDPQTGLERLSASLQRLTDYADAAGLALALRPSGRSSIATIGQFERLLQWLPASAKLFLAGDIAAMLRQGEVPTIDFLARHLDRLRCVFAADIQTGVRDIRSGLWADLPVGRGDIDLRRIVAGLEEMPYSGPLVIRVDGFAAEGLAIAKEAFAAVFGEA